MVSRLAIEGFFVWIRPPHPSPTAPPSPACNPPQKPRVILSGAKRNRTGAKRRRRRRDLRGHSYPPQGDPDASHRPTGFSPQKPYGFRGPRVILSGAKRNRTGAKRRRRRRDLRGHSYPRKEIPMLRIALRGFHPKILTASGEPLGFDYGQKCPPLRMTRR